MTGLWKSAFVETRVSSRPRCDYGESQAFYIGFLRSPDLMAHRTCYISVVLYIAGFVVLGACMEQLNIAGLVLGWGIAQCVVVFNTVAVCEYMCDLCLYISQCS